MEIEWFFVCFKTHSFSYRTDGLDRGVYFTIKSQSFIHVFIHWFIHLFGSASEWVIDKRRWRGASIDECIWKRFTIRNRYWEQSYFSSNRIGQKNGWQQKSVSLPGIVWTRYGSAIPCRKPECVGLSGTACWYEEYLCPTSLPDLRASDACLGGMNEMAFINFGSLRHILL